MTNVTSVSIPSDVVSELKERKISISAICRRAVVKALDDVKKSEQEERRVVAAKQNTHSDH